MSCNCKLERGPITRKLSISSRHCSRILVARLYALSWASRGAGKRLSCWLHSSQTLTIAAIWLDFHFGRNDWSIPALEDRYCRKIWIIQELLRSLLVIIVKSGHFVEHFEKIKRGLAVVDVHCILHLVCLWKIEGRTVWLKRGKVVSRHCDRWSDFITNRIKGIHGVFVWWWLLLNWFIRNNFGNWAVAIEIGCAISLGRKIELVGKSICNKSVNILLIWLKWLETR